MQLKSYRAVTECEINGNGSKKWNDLFEVLYRGSGVNFFWMMSLRLERPGKPIEDSTIRWADDVAMEIHDDDDDLSISSEEETGTAYDGEQRSRSKSVVEIWDNDYIWQRLQVEFWYTIFFRWP